MSAQIIEFPHTEEPTARIYAFPDKFSRRTNTAIIASSTIVCWCVLVGLLFVGVFWLGW